MLKSEIILRKRKKYQVENKLMNVINKHKEKQSKEEQDIQNTFEIKQNSTKVNLENSTDSKQPKPSKIKSYGENIDNNLQNENDKDTWKAAISKIASIRGMFSNMNIDNQIPKIPNERELLLSQYDNQNFEPKEEKYKILEDAIKRIDRQSKNANRMMNPSGGLTGIFMNNQIFKVNQQQKLKEIHQTINIR